MQLTWSSSILHYCNVPMAILQYYNLLSCSTVNCLWLLCSNRSRYLAVLQLSYSYLAVLQFIILKYCNLPTAVLQNCNLTMANLRHCNLLSCSTAISLQLSFSIETFYFAVLQLSSSFLTLQQLTFLKHWNLLPAIFQYCNLPLAILQYYDLLLFSTESTATYI